MEIEQVAGIDRASAKQLRRIGICTVEALVKRAAHQTERHQISTVLGISQETILSWVNLAELFRIKGLSTVYVELLAEGGVDGLSDLANWEPQELRQSIIETNRIHQCVRQIPSPNAVLKWIEQARLLVNQTVTKVTDTPNPCRSNIPFS